MTAGEYVQALERRCKVAEAAVWVGAARWAMDAPNPTNRTTLETVRQWTAEAERLVEKQA